MASWCKKAGGGLAVLAVTVGLVAGCTPNSGGDEAARQAAGAPMPKSALSSFLAGRLAHQGGDTRAAAEYYAQALKHDPDNVELLQRAFTLMVAEGRIDDAVPLGQRLLSYDADAPIPLMMVGVAEARQGLYAQAEARFAALPKRGVNVFLAPLLSAWCRVGEGRTDAAIALLEPLAATKGLEPLHAFHAGLINDLAGRADAAEGHYKVALSSALAIRTIEAAGSFYQRNGRSEQARALYDQYEAEHPETMLFDGRSLLKAGGGVPRAVPDAKAGLAQALFDAASMMRQGNVLDLALVLSRLTLALDPDFTLARMTVGDILSSQERLADANAVYGGIDPASAAHDYGRLRVAVNLDEMGDTDDALKLLDAIAQSRPEGVDALVTKGDVLRKHERFGDAARAYEAAFSRIGKIQERHWLLHFSRGIAYERSKQWPKAEADFQKALELKPDQPDVLNYLGYSWVDRGMRLEEGRKMIEKAVELRPKDGAIVDSLGWALYRMGDFQGAVKQLERAVELRPEDPTINDHLGDAYWQVGRADEASFQWQRALTLDPEPEQMDSLNEKVRTGQVPATPAVK